MTVEEDVLTMTTITLYNAHMNSLHKVLLLMMMDAAAADDEEEEEEKKEEEEADDERCSQLWILIMRDRCWSAEEAESECIQYVNDEKSVITTHHCTVVKMQKFGKAVL